MPRIALIVTCLAAILAAPVLAAQPIVSVLIPLYARPADEVAALFASSRQQLPEGDQRIRLPEDVAITPIVSHNAILARGPQAGIDELREVLANLDIPEGNVRVVVRQLEVIIPQSLDALLRHPIHDSSGAVATDVNQKIRPLLDRATSPLHWASVEIPQTGEAVLGFDGMTYMLSATARGLGTGAFRLRIGLTAADGGFSESFAAALITGHQFIVARRDASGALVGPVHAFSAEPVTE